MSGETITQAVAKRDTTAVIEQYRADFAAVLPSHIRPDQWVRLTTGLFRRDEKLQQILKANPGSVLSALLDAARLGLDVGDNYYLLPFGGEVVGTPSYTGLIELMYRSDAVQTVKCAIVYERDEDFYADPVSGRRRQRFEWVPSEMDRPHHAPQWFGDRGQMIGAYAYAELRGGAVSQVVIRSKAEIEQVKAVSKTAHKADSIWNKWPDRAWLKTVLRELSKFVPTSVEDLRTKRYDETAAPIPADQAPTAVYLGDHDFVDGELVDDDTRGTVTNTARPPVPVHTGGRTDGN